MTNAPPPLNETAYRRYMRLAHRLGQLIGMRLTLAGHPRSLQSGQIFLFNHFTRLETSIPPYLLHLHTGAICRSVAHQSLFGLHKYLTRFLWDGGCLPSKMPGLLPYLAAEILRGRKVVIFPEGGLVKDKKVFNAKGEFAIETHAPGGPRKHHRGAAVLAWYLDIFKAALRVAEAKADEATLAKWQAELALPNRAALLAAIHAPTLLVPSTLTFFPLRHEGNMLTRLVAWLVPNLSETARDELVTETNLLLHPTDLTVNVGAPLVTGWEDKLCDATQLQTLLAKMQTLEDLFALELSDNGWFKTGLRPTTEAAIERLRDKATRALYGGLTVNIQHLVAGLIHSYYHAGRRHVPVTEFNAALLWAAHRLFTQAQKTHSLTLHRTLGGAGRLHSLALTMHPEARAFMESLMRARLVKRRGGDYVFSSLLEEGLGREEIRTENPVQLHVNEATTQPAVALALRWATEQATRYAQGQTAEWAHLVLEIARQTAHARYQAAGAEALKAGAGAVAPFLLQPHAAKAKGIIAKGVVLLHGMGATPAQVRPLAEDLAAQGYTVYGPTLAGHGGKSSDLRHATPEHWLAETRLACQVLKALGCTEVQGVGFSTGGLLVLQEAAMPNAALSHAVAIAPALTLVSRKRFLLPLGLVLNVIVGKTLGRVFKSLRLGVTPWHTMRPPYPAEQYARVPIMAVARLVMLGRRVRRLAPRLKVPVTLMHGTEDKTTHFKASQAFANAARGKVNFLTLPGGRHDGVRENAYHTWAHVSSALNAPHKIPGMHEQE